MFLGIEIALVDLLIGVGIGFMFFVLAVLFLRERKERRFAEDLTDSFQRLADSHWQNFRAEERRAEKLKVDLEDAQKASDLWFGSARKLSDEVNAESHRREVAEIEMDSLVEQVIDLVDEAEDLEDALEELEEEADDLEEIAQEAVEGWADADNLTARTIAWGERVLGLLERIEERRQ
ncbi:hypothetical protein LCGC14_1699740 [marine sediment metagenome]|uniref:Uncharacterized protein n=1 Tax=marine sediment metagenome TaxID=412755 RepID=A0A0F9HIY7_9ZZZZ